MRDRRDTALRQLREAVDCLPRTTRLAMLEGISRNPIIVGAYTDPAGICPMLAAHRAGGRTSFIGFAKAWDGFAFRSSPHKRSRLASQRELLVLRTYLEASLLDDDCPDHDLRAAAAEHRALRTRRGAEGAADRTTRGTAQTGHGTGDQTGDRTGDRTGDQTDERAGDQIGNPTEPAPHPPRPGDPDRSEDLGRRSGWAWMRVVRSLDDYDRALSAVERESLTGRTGGQPAAPASAPTSAPA